MNKTAESLREEDARRRKKAEVPKRSLTFRRRFDFRVGSETFININPESGSSFRFLDSLVDRGPNSCCALVIGLFDRHNERKQLSYRLRLASRPTPKLVA